MPLASRDERAAWPMDDPQPLEPPQPARGLQGFWNWTPDAGAGRLL